MNKPVFRMYTPSRTTSNPTEKIVGAYEMGLNVFDAEYFLPRAVHGVTVDQVTAWYRVCKAENRLRTGSTPVPPEGIAVPLASLAAIVEANFDPGVINGKAFSIGKPPYKLQAYCATNRRAIENVIDTIYAQLGATVPIRASEKVSTAVPLDPWEFVKKNPSWPK